jgi:hypothetical protein
VANGREKAPKPGRVPSRACVYIKCVKFIFQRLRRVKQRRYSSSSRMRLRCRWAFSSMGAPASRRTQRESAKNTKFWFALQTAQKRVTRGTCSTASASHLANCYIFAPCEGAAPYFRNSAAVLLMRLLMADLLRL